MGPNWGHANHGVTNVKGLEWPSLSRLHILLKRGRAYEAYLHAYLPMGLG